MKARLARSVTIIIGPFHLCLSPQLCHLVAPKLKHLVIDSLEVRLLCYFHSRPEIALVFPPDIRFALPSLATKVHLSSHSLCSQSRISQAKSSCVLTALSSTFKGLTSLNVLHSQKVQLTGSLVSTRSAAPASQQLNCHLMMPCVIRMQPRR